MLDDTFRQNYLRGIHMGKYVEKPRRSPTRSAPSFPGFPVRKHAADLCRRAARCSMVRLGVRRNTE